MRGFSVPLFFKQTNERMKLNLMIPVFVLVILCLASCEKDDPVIPNEEELITTLTYTLTPADGGMPLSFHFQDLDGDGGGDPTVTGGTLEAHTTYAGTLDLLNEQVSPPESITEEILEEAVDHQFFFQTTLDGLSITYNDQDANGNPLGLTTNLTTDNAGSGTITIILRHEPDKTATGVSEGNISNAGGETDIEVSFDVDVQ